MKIIKVPEWYYEEQKDLLFKLDAENARLKEQIKQSEAEIHYHKLKLEWLNKKLNE